MAYVSTYDERFYGTFISSAPGVRDAYSFLNSIFVLAEGSVGYGELNYQAFTNDIDIYSLGSLGAGRSGRVRPPCAAGISRRAAQFRRSGQKTLYQLAQSDDLGVKRHAKWERSVDTITF